MNFVKQLNVRNLSLIEKISQFGLEGTGGDYSTYYVKSMTSKIAAKQYLELALLPKASDKVHLGV